MSDDPIKQMVKQMKDATLDKIAADFKNRNLRKLPLDEQVRILQASLIHEDPGAVDYHTGRLMLVGLMQYAKANTHVVIKTCGGSLLDITKQRLDKKKRDKEKREIVKTKVKAYDSLIDRLYYEYIGDKQVKDCTKAEVLREGNRKTEGGAKLSIDSAFYLSLAAIMKPGETVAEARERDKGAVRKLLERYYGEKADAI